MIDKIKLDVTVDGSITKILLKHNSPFFFLNNIYKEYIRGENKISVGQEPP